MTSLGHDLFNIKIRKRYKWNIDYFRLAFLLSYVAKTLWTDSNILLCVCLLAQVNLAMLYHSQGPYFHYHIFWFCFALGLLCIVLRPLIVIFAILIPVYFVDMVVSC